MFRVDPVRATKVRVMSGIRQCLGGLTPVCQMIQNLFDVRRILYTGDDPDSLFALPTNFYIDLDDTSLLRKIAWLS